MMTDIAPTQKIINWAIILILIVLAYLFLPILPNPTPRDPWDVFYSGMVSPRRYFALIQQKRPWYLGG